jgi:hypothetical protein
VPPDDASGPRGVLQRSGLSPKALVAGITALAGLVGAIKTLTVETTGASLTPGHLLFYIGASLIAAYISVAAGAMLGGGAVGLVISAFGADDSESGEYAIIAGIIIVAGLTFFALLSAGALWDYEDTDQMGRIFFSLIGLALLAVPIYLYSRNSGEGRSGSP